jgi:hypothetical protein
MEEVAFPPCHVIGAIMILEAYLYCYVKSRLLLPILFSYFVVPQEHVVMLIEPDSERICL